jgi:hypothetical protein
MNLRELLAQLPAAGGRSEELAPLARILGLRPDEVASFRLGPRYHYRPFTVAKRDGRRRDILAPSPALKALQRRLLDGLLGPLPVHICAIAFRRDQSVVTNARRHIFRTLVATVDLCDFFASTRAWRVRRFFAGPGYRGDAPDALMRLCVYRGGLPQGAPTSPYLSNLVNYGLDLRLWHLAGRSAAVYTRYGDDLTFSWNAERLPDGFRVAVEEHLAAAGYAVQPLKGWRVSRIEERPRVTGLVLTPGGGIRVPWPGRWRAWWWRWRALWSNSPAVRAKAEGYAAWLGMVHRQGRKQR